MKIYKKLKLEIARHSFSGACFPKDSLASIKFVKNFDIDLNALLSTVKVHNKLRTEYIG